MTEYFIEKIAKYKKLEDSDLDEEVLRQNREMHTTLGASLGGIAGSAASIPFMVSSPEKALAYSLAVPVGSALVGAGAGAINAKRQERKVKNILSNLTPEEREEQLEWMNRTSKPGYQMTNEDWQYVTPVGRYMYPNRVKTAYESVEDGLEKIARQVEVTNENFNEEFRKQSERPHKVLGGMAGGTLGAGLGSIVGDKMFNNALEANQHEFNSLLRSSEDSSRDAVRLLFQGKYRDASRKARDAQDIAVKARNLPMPSVTKNYLVPTLIATGAGAYLGTQIGKRLINRDIDDYLASLTPEERAKEIEAMNKSRVHRK